MTDRYLRRAIWRKRNKINKVKLYAPEDYWELTSEQRKTILNKCGPKGFGWIVPDTIWFLNIGEACNIHDYMYAVGVTLEDKKEADRVLFNNILRLIEAKTKNRILLKLRKRRALIYYEAVKHFGGPAFWKDKNPAVCFREPKEL